MDKQPLRIILVESDPTSARSMMQLLNDTDLYKPIVVLKTCFQDAEESMIAERFDVMLLSLDLSDALGLQNLSKIRENHKTTPIIIANGNDDETSLTAAIQRDAQDYWVRNKIGAEQMGQRIRLAIQRKKFAEAKHKKSVFKITEAVETNLEHLASSIKAKVGEFRNLLDKPALDRSMVGNLLNSFKGLSKEVVSGVEEIRFLAIESQLHKLESYSEDYKKYHLLIVDDEEDLPRLISKRLKRLGFVHVDTAQDGQEAYNLCVNKSVGGGKYDIIISDWRMPKLSGMAFLEKIRRNEKLKETLFVLMSGVGDIDTVKEAAKMHVSDFIVKPFKNEDLDLKICQLVQRLRVTKL